MNIIDFKDLNSQFPVANVCIYCGSKDELTREHIIPYGLSGPGVLPKSSCKSCSMITSKFEMDVLRGPLRGLRAYLKLSTRRPRSMPIELPLTIIKKGKEEEVLIPIREHPIMVSLPSFSPPSKITGNYVDGISIRGIALYNFGHPVAKVLKRFSAENLRKTEESKPISFARLIGKIGWAMAVAHGYTNQLDGDLVDAFMNKPDMIGRWVGTYTDKFERQEGLLHEIRFREDNDLGLLIADIQLFSIYQTPRYGVILGEL